MRIVIAIEGMRLVKANLASAVKDGGDIEVNRANELTEKASPAAAKVRNGVRLGLLTTFESGSVLPPISDVSGQSLFGRPSRCQFTFAAAGGLDLRPSERFQRPSPAVPWDQAVRLAQGRRLDPSRHARGKSCRL
jgi:hypothetical protein